MFIWNLYLSVSVHTCVYTLSLTHTRLHTDSTDNFLSEIYCYNQDIHQLNSSQLIFYELLRLLSWILSIPELLFLITAPKLELLLDNFPITKFNISTECEVQHFQLNKCKSSHEMPPLTFPEKTMKPEDFSNFCNAQVLRSNRYHWITTSNHTNASCQPLHQHPKHLATVLLTARSMAP